MGHFLDVQIVTFVYAPIVCVTLLLVCHRGGEFYFCANPASNRIK